MALSTRLLTLRNSPILHKLPPYLSLICILTGIGWLLLLPLNDYSRGTYISENAILPGQVHTYFGGSEHNIFRAYRQEVFQLSLLPDEQERHDGIERIMKEIGLRASQQPYRYSIAGADINGTNVYGLLQGPRADATEAMVLMAAWTNFEGEINYSGVALALTLARYFKRWSIWSKDIFVLIPADSVYGSEAWVSAYHGTALEQTSSRNVSALSIKAGALQAAVALDYPVGPWGHRYDKLDIVYDGINGASPNLDLLNTAISIARGQMGISCSLHGLKDHSDSYKDRLTTLAKGLMSQAAGHATGPHSAFMPYHIDAITIKTVGDGWYDEMGLGRVAESLFRSINNLLEHLHQSFFFYILLSTQRFVSIGNYLPAAMIIAGSFTINALALWVLSGKHQSTATTASLTDELDNAGEDKDNDAKATELKEVTSEKDETPPKRQIPIEHDGEVILVPEFELETAERKMFLPAAIIVLVHLACFIVMLLLIYVDADIKTLIQAIVISLSFLVPIMSSVLLVFVIGMSVQQIEIMQSFSLLFLGAALSTWATINFSLAVVVGLLAAPLSFVRPLSLDFSKTKTVFQWIEHVASLLIVPIHLVFNPPLALAAICFIVGKDLEWVLLEVAKGWSAQGVWSSLILWGVWWPAWLLGSVVLVSGPIRGIDISSA